MKQLLLFLLILPALACSSTLTKPMANVSASVSTETAMSSPAPLITPTGTASLETCTVTADALHLRDAPNIEGLVIAWLIKGDQLTILPGPPAGAWLRVQTDEDLTGWIHGAYCER